MSTRASSLDAKALCGKAPSLNLGAGRSAAMSTAFHALCHDPVSEDARTKLARLTKAEREAIEQWHSPHGLSLEGDNEGLAYSDAEREFQLAVKRGWVPCAVDDSEAWLTGHPDMAWVKGDTLVIGDLKRTRFTAPPPGESLQTLAYVAMMHARDHGKAVRFAYVAHWYLEEGVWDVSGLIDLHSLEAADIYARLEHAIENASDEYSTGPHCSGCWSRLRCPAHMVQIDADRIAVPGLPTDEVTDDDVGRLLVAQKQLEDTAAAIGAFTKDYVRARGLPIVYEGKQWGPNTQAGRKSLDRAAVESELAAHGKSLSDFETQGQPIEVFRWKKSR